MREHQKIKRNKTKISKNLKDFEEDKLTAINAGSDEDDEEIVQDSPSLRKRLKN